MPLESAATSSNPRTECNNVTCPTAGETTIRQPQVTTPGTARAGASGSLQEGAPGRAARSPAIAAVLILFAQTGNGCKLPQKPNGLRRRETAGKPGQKTKAITDPRGWFVKTLSRIGAQGRKPRRKDRAAVRCPPAPKRRRQKAWNANASDRLTTATGRNAGAR
jgi:hypothetical protein